MRDRTERAEGGSDTPNSVRIGLLLDFYGELLTSRQKELAIYYYEDDLSLGEISDITGLTRQGVRASLEKSKQLLLRYEEKLGLAGRFSEARKESDRIAAETEKLRAGENADIAALCEAASRLQALYD